MGRDKALLEVDGEPLVAQVAREVSAAAGSVAVIGAPERYRHLGLEVVPDRIPGAGPLGGIDTALSLGRAEWNLIVACDLPLARADLLRSLVEQARKSRDVCVIPYTDRPEPLCAVYSLRVASAIRKAVDAGVRKVLQALDGLEVEWRPTPDCRQLMNVNTVQDWEAFLGG
jgi:molybdopterin-guanine dinucleotide biosynthesis protein A